MADPALVAHLHDLGATEAQTAGLDDGELIGLAGDLVVSAGQDLTLAELARRCGVTEERVRALYRSAGLDADALAGFGEGDVDMVDLAASDESGIVDQVADELLRVTGTSLRRVAEATVAAYVQDVENAPEREDVDAVAMAELNRFSSELVLTFAATMPTLFRHHMWTAVRQQRSGQREVARPELIRAGVGFVDLVGFTPISRSLSPAELTALLDDFERLAFQIATDHGGRVVKSIGDEVMVTGADLESVAAIAMALVASFGEEPTTRPRGAVSSGQVVFRMGDLYGPVVNVAARLVAVASPGEVLTDVGEADAARIALRPAGSRELKGFDEATDVWSVTPAPGSDDG